MHHCIITFISCAIAAFIISNVLHRYLLLQSDMGVAVAVRTHRMLCWYGGREQRIIADATEKSHCHCQICVVGAAAVHLILGVSLNIRLPTSLRLHFTFL